jgi:hypothetical protein
VVIEAVADQLTAADQQFLREGLKTITSIFSAVLIGKDGGVKLRQTKPITSALLFATIDAMPMRQQEMRK